jgi:hypothetical protein
MTTKPKKKPAKKRPRGRPSLYPSRVEPKLRAIETATAAGATREEIAEMCGIGLTTLKEHVNTFPALATALRAGDTAAVGLVEAALFKRAVGYSHPAVKIMAVSDGQGHGSRIEEVPYSEHYPPDTAAIALFLTNRDPERWKHKVTHAPEDNKPWPVRLFLTSEAHGTTD